jgi:hypothetical protein
MTWWAWYLRGTLTIARTGGTLRLILTDLAAGIRWWWQLRRERP